MAIVAVTAAGQTARLLAAQRPTAAILAATPSPATAKRLALTWGVTPFVTGSADLEDVRRALSGHALLPAGGLVVFVSVTEALDRGDANFVHVERL
jgi:pyruvate kinase